MTAHGDRLGLVVIDTLSASTPGADENLARDMGPVLRSLQDLAREFAVLILVIAHPGKDEAKKIRGWSGLLANADGVILIEAADSSGVRRGTIEKVKNGPAGGTFGFRLARVAVGADEDGDEIDTCVIEETDAPEPSKPGRKPTKASATGDLILKALHLCLDYCPVPVNAVGAIGLKGVEVQNLRAQAFTNGLGPSEPDIPVDASPDEAKRARRSWQDKRKVDFDRGLQHELANGRLRQHERVVWETFAKKG
jgi:AAA domain-containing protein